MTVIQGIAPDGSAVRVRMNADGQVLTSATAGTDSQWHTDTLARLTGINTNLAGGTYSLVSQSIGSPGPGGTLFGPERRSLIIQFSFNTPSTDQVVDLELSPDYETSWYSVTDILGVTFTAAQLTAYAARGVKPSIEYRVARQEFTHFRCRWVSGTAASLGLQWVLT